MLKLLILDVWKQVTFISLENLVRKPLLILKKYVLVISKEEKIDTFVSSIPPTQAGISVSYVTKVNSPVFCLEELEEHSF